MFGRQIEEQVDAIKSLKPSFDKTNDLKQIENIFPRSIVNKMILINKNILIHKTGVDN